MQKSKKRFRKKRPTRPGHMTNLPKKKTRHTWNMLKHIHNQPLDQALKPWASTPNGPKGYLNNQSRRCIPHIPGTGTPLSFSNLLVEENSIVVAWVRTEQACNMDDWKKCARGGCSSAVSFTWGWFPHTLTHVTGCRRIWAGIGNHSSVTMAN